MKSLSTIMICFIALFCCAACADVSNSPTVNDDTLTFSLSAFASETPVKLQVKDTKHIRILENRMQQIQAMMPDLKIPNYSSGASILGYKGLGLSSSDVINKLIIVNAFNGQMTVCPSAISSALYHIYDYNSEMEHLIAKIGEKEYPSIYVNGEISLANLLPVGFNKIITKYGILVLEDLYTDTFNIDFSLLNDQCSFVPDRVKRPIFRDIQITRALEISSSKEAFRISAPEGIATLEKEPSYHIGSDNYYPNSSKVDSLLINTIPRLDTLSGTSTSKSIAFQQYSIFSPDNHQFCYLIRTTDLGIVYLRPVSMFIGGIDRLIFFWIYSSDSIFDKETLKKVIDRVAAIHTSPNINFSENRQTNKFVDLFGRELSESNLLNKASIHQSSIQKRGKLDRRLIINVK